MCRDSGVCVIYAGFGGYGFWSGLTAGRWWTGESDNHEVGDRVDRGGWTEPHGTADG